MRHKIIIIIPSRPSQLRFSAESVSSELSRSTRDSDSSRSGPRQIRLGRLVSDSAETLNRVDFALQEPIGLMLKKLEAGLLGAGKDQLKLGLLIEAVLELYLKSVR